MNVIDGDVLTYGNVLTKGDVLTKSGYVLVRGRFGKGTFDW